MTKLRVALAQTQPVNAKEKTAIDDDLASGSLFPTLQANLRDTVKYVERAVEQKADIVLFPEYYLEGILNEQRQYLSLASVQLEQFVQRLAKEHKIGIAGTIVHGRINSTRVPAPPTSDPFSHISLRSSQPDSPPTNASSEWLDYLRTNRDVILRETEHVDLENEAFITGTDGELLGRYVKRNLWHPEREYLSPGDKKGDVFDTPWGKIGFLICWDLSHPASAQHLADQGAEIILVPTYWMATDSEPMLSKYNKDYWYELKTIQSLALSRSFETETFLFMSNAGGPREQDFMGGSGAWAPLLGRIDDRNGHEADCWTVEVDLGLLTDARELYKIREDWSNKELR